MGVEHWATSDSGREGFSRPTVLIFGAGASKAYGYPLGYELVDLMHEFSDMERALADHLFRRFDPEMVDEFFHRLTWSGVRSVDKFLECPQYAYLTEIGSEAIAFVLAYCELNAKARLPLRASEIDSYACLADYLCEFPNEFELLGSRKLSIITFNYERSLERYLTFAFASRWHYTHDMAWHFFKSTIPILHMYGSLGDEEPWEMVNFKDPDAIAAAASKIRIISQTRDDDENFQIAERWISNAEVVAFLGFGFDLLNVKRLGAFGTPPKLGGDGSCKLKLRGLYASHPNMSPEPEGWIYINNLKIASDTAWAPSLPKIISWAATRDC